MYLSGDNATTGTSLPLSGNYVMWSAHLSFPGYKGRNPAEEVESLLHNYERNLILQKHLRPFNQDGKNSRDNKCERFKGATEGHK